MNRRRFAAVAITVAILFAPVAAAQPLASVTHAFADLWQTILAAITGEDSAPDHSAESAPLPPAEQPQTTESTENPDTEDGGGRWDPDG